MKKNLPTYSTLSILCLIFGSGCATNKPSDSHTADGTSLSNADLSNSTIWTGVPDTAIMDLTDESSNTHTKDEISLLDAELSDWEVWTGVPDASITNLPDGYIRGDNPKKAPAVGLGDPYGIFTTARDDHGELILKVSGEVYAGLTSKESYSNYHLSLQVKWGEEKWAPRLNEKRDNGILYHCSGKHGAFWNVWKSSLELQVQEGDFGDLYQLAGTSSMVTLNNKRVWDPTAEAKPHRRKGIRSVDAESPHGEWTQIDLYVLEDSAVHVINGTVVMAISGTKIKGEPLTEGQLQIQSEGAECYYKEIRIRSIEALPDPILEQLN